MFTDPSLTLRMTKSGEALRRQREKGAKICVHQHHLGHLRAIGELKSRSQILTPFFLLSLFISLGISRLYLAEGQVAEDTDERTARAEVDAGLLDERVRVVLLSFCALAGDTDLQSTQVAEADDFTTFEGIGDDIFQGYEHSEHVRFVNGTSLLDALGHFADVDVTRSLYVTVVLGSGFLVARVDTRGYGIGYVSCHSFLSFEL